MVVMNFFTSKLTERRFVGKEKKKNFFVKPGVTEKNRGRGGSQ